MKSCRLRKFRKAAHLTQREVATLVGYASQRAYSDMELGVKRPALGTALACSILFDVTLDELFPSLIEHVERDVLARSQRLYEVLADEVDRDVTATVLSGVVARLGVAA